MQTVTRIIIEQGLKNRFVNTGQLRRLLGGGDARRYGLVNRALKSGELLRLQRGQYILSDHYRTHPAHPFALAQALGRGSYVSFETALSYYGWIPEKVITTASVVPGRKSRRYENEEKGVFTFHPLAIEKGCFLDLVARHIVDGQSILVAKPCRALMDLVCLRKQTWQGMTWFSESLRIDINQLTSISEQDTNTLKRVYQHKRMKSFLSSFHKELRTVD